MDNETKDRIRSAVQAFIDAGDWNAIERCWEPHVIAGDADALGELVMIYENYGFDEGEEKNRHMRQMLEDAAAHGHGDATYFLSVRQVESAERDRLLLKAGKLGNPDAQRDLGAYYATGDWTGPKDTELAVQWYARAAEQGNADAQYNLGFMYILGEGTAPDVGKGLRWLRLSAEQGDICAMRLLGELRRNACHGVARNLEEAELWERRYEETERAWAPK